MRALFLIPPRSFNPRGQMIDRVYGCNYGFDYKPAIHLLQAATYARDALGWDVRLLDCPAEGVGTAGMEEEARRSDVVLLWATYLSAAPDLAAARGLRRVAPGARFVFLGAGATWRPEEFELGGRSWVLLGEPEHTLRDLDAAWRGERAMEGTPGLGYWRSDGQFERGPFRPLLDVTSLPHPDRRLLRGRYTANRLGDGPVTVVAASRGCGFRCTFCCTHALDQAIDLEFKRMQPAFTERPPLRKRSVEQIVAEFQDIAALGYRGVEIADNVFTWGKRRTMELCEGLSPLGLRWICLARANMLHDGEMLRAMAAAGCALVYMGSESFDDGMLETMAKEIKVRDVERAVRTCRESGIEPEVSVLIGGSPAETWGSLLRSWRAARSLGTRFVHFSVALPAPSTALYDQALREGWFIEGDFRPADNAREAIVDLPRLSHRELRLALKLAYTAQYLTPAGAWEQAREVRSVGALRRKLAAAGRLLGFLGERQGGSRIPAGRVTPLP